LFSLNKNLFANFRPGNPLIGDLSSVSKLLNNGHLTIIDVGATGGSDPIWDSAGAACRFVNFDPDSRADLKSSPQITNYPIGLSDQTGTKTLNLTKFPSASSLYLPNQQLMDKFANHDSTQIVGESEIEVTTLDVALEDQDIGTCFLKVDTEGADLDVLRGGNSVLQQSCVGVQVEITFAERHVGAPAFHEVDRYLRDNGFILFDLRCDYWIRRNNTYFLTSNPQLIWADGIYFLDADVFLERLSETAPAARTSLLGSFMVVLSAHGTIDYAVEILETAADRNLTSIEVVDAYKKAFRQAAPNLPTILLKLTLHIGLGIAMLLPAILFPSPRKRVFRFLLRRISLFGTTLAKTDVRRNYRDL